MVLTVSFVISLVTGLSCHHHQHDAKHHRRLDASVGASGPHDFAVRFRAVRLAAPKRPPHSVPNVRDDRETPLQRAGTARDIEVIWVRRERIYFCRQDWTGSISLIRLRKSGGARNAITVARLQAGIATAQSVHQASPRHVCFGIDWAAVSLFLEFRDCFGPARFRGGKPDLVAGVQVL